MYLDDRPLKSRVDSMISPSVRFIGFKEFYNKCEYIKNVYKRMLYREKRMYKYYVYSHRHIKEYSCDLIWGFLNNDGMDEFEITIEALEDEAHKYRF